MTDSMSRSTDRYQVGELIGEGAAARVYIACDTEKNRHVAMKALKESLCQDPDYVDRFLREARAAAALNHPNIVTVYDVGTLDNAPCTMQEIVEGRDLGDILKDGGKLPLEKVLIIGIQLCKALDYAHTSGVVHRNIAPDNIVVLPDGISIKLRDFGVARGGDVEGSQNPGTPPWSSRYGSPEQEAGDTVDGRSDLFAVGVILYEMSTGKPAFDAGMSDTQMDLHTHKAPVPRGEFPADLPAGLCQIIQRLLQEDPDDRYQTGDEVVQALTGELQVLRSRQEQHGTRTTLPLKARWSLSVAVIVAVVMAVAGSVVFKRLSESMTAQAVDSGASFARFVASEMANPLLGEEWILVDAFVTEVAGRDDFSYLTVIDDANIVRGSSDKERVGEAYSGDSNETLISDRGGIRTTRSQLADGSTVFNITAPVSFQDTPVGSIVLGLSQDGLREVESAAAQLLLLLAAVVVTAVAVVFFVYGGRIDNAVALVSSSMRRFGAGDAQVRIIQTRNDRVGELFQSFNAMAAAMQGGVPAENGQQETADDAGGAPGPKVTIASLAAATRQVFFQRSDIGNYWNSARIRTAAFFRLHVSTLREKTSALVARFLQLLQRAIASKLEKLESVRQAADTGVESSAPADETAAPAADKPDAGEAGAFPPAAVSVKERKPDDIEQGVAAHVWEPDPDQAPPAAGSDVLVSQQKSDGLDDGGLQAEQRRRTSDVEGAVARAVAKHEASTAEHQAAGLGIEQQKAGDTLEGSAADRPGSGSKPRTGAGLNGSGVRESAILLARLAPKPSEQ